MYSLDSVITVVDAKVILDRLAEEKPEGVENESVEQVCFADKVLLNKTDLADEAKLKKIEGEIRKLNPTAPILRCLHSKVSPKELLNIRSFDLKRVLDFDPEFLDPDQVSLIFLFLDDLNLHFIAYLSPRTVAILSFILGT
jgi:G3E family GTPase